VPLVCFKIKFVVYQSLIFVDNKNSCLEMFHIIFCIWHFGWYFVNSRSYWIKCSSYLYPVCLVSMSFPTCFFFAETFR